MSDPVCHIAPDIPLTQPAPHNLPAIPPAQPNVASLVATVNAMRQTILVITGQQGIQGPRGAKGAAGQDANAKGQWSEMTRTTEKVKIRNPDDPSQFVEIERINRLVMRNASTGQTWTWNR